MRGAAGGGRRFSAPGLALVAAVHVGLLWALLSARVVPVPDDVVTLFVETLRPEAPAAEAPKPASKTPSLARDRPPPTPLSVAAPAPADEASVPPAPPVPPVVDHPAPLQRSPGPVVLGSELSLACANRPPPRYPPLSRRLGEAGKVVLSVELDEDGAVVAARVVDGSGFARLDEAALAAVKGWRCTPARRDGRPVRAVATQPFKFVLEGN